MRERGVEMSQNFDRVGVYEMGTTRGEQFGRERQKFVL